MGRPKLSDIDVATTDRILDAAEAAFGKQGFEAARLEDIASAAGVRRPSLLYHFPSKDKLYAATVTRVFGKLRDALVGAMTSDGPFVERLDASIRSYVEFLAEHPNHTRIFVREVLDAGGTGEKLIREQVVPILDLAEAFVKEAGKGFIKPGIDVRAAVLQVVGAAIFYAIAGPLRAPLWDGSEALTTKEAGKHRDRRFVAGLRSLLGAMVVEDKALAAAYRRGRSKKLKK